MMTYSCDVCGRQCSRIHTFGCYGMDTAACDDCAGYEWEAYDEDADPLLYPEDLKERAYQEREPHWRDSP